MRNYDFGGSVVVISIRKGWKESYKNGRVIESPYFKTIRTTKDKIDYYKKKYGSAINSIEIY